MKLREINPGACEACLYWTDPQCCHSALRVTSRPDEFCEHFTPKNGRCCLTCARASGVGRFSVIRCGECSKLRSCPLWSWRGVREEERTKPQRNRPAMVRIEPGTFLMGSPADEEGRDDDETPHEVRLTRPFELGCAPVTQAQWTRLMKDNPSDFEGDDHPVERVSWLDAARFCNALSEREGLRPAYTIQGKGDNAKVQWHRDADGFRLPTEAEWEYAARAGKRTLYAGSDDPDAVAWWAHNSGDSPRWGTQPVCRKKPNAWGLCDMTGQVWEWCWDWFAKYPKGPVTDPIGPGSGSNRVLRGGSWWNNVPRLLRVAYRIRLPPSGRGDDLGFRLARSLPPSGW